jgi:hypothetical protein
MKKNHVKLISVIAILLALSVSVIWTYNNIHTQTITVSYIADAIIIIMLFITLLYNYRVKSTIKNNDNYQDWITEGSVDKNDRLNINVFSLEDLIKLAMDLDKRVIHDPKPVLRDPPAKRY